MGEVINNPPITLASNRKQMLPAAEDVVVEPREIDKILSETAGLVSHWNQFRKFLLDALQVRPLAYLMGQVNSC